MIDIEECVHGMGNPQHCVLCKGSSLPNVYVTAGGMSYHQTPNCPNLIKGQAKVENPAPIETVPHGSEKMQNRNPCKKCKPEAHGGGTRNGFINIQLATPAKALAKAAT